MTRGNKQFERSIPWLLVLGILGISSSGVLVKQLQIQSSPAATITAWRVLYAALLLGPMALRRPQGLGKALRDHGLALAISALLLAVHFVSFTASLFRNEVARAVLLCATQPFFVTLGAWWFFRERPRPFEWLFLGLAGVGAAAMLTNTGTAGDTLGDLLALLASLTFAGYVLLGRRLRRHLDLTHYTAPLYAGAGILLLAFALFRGDPLWLPSARAQGLLLALAVFPTLLGHAVFSFALRFTPSRVVSLAFLGEVPGAALLAWWFLGEPGPRGLALAGAVVCVAGVLGLVAAGSRRPASD